MFELADESVLLVIVILPMACANRDTDNSTSRTKADAGNSTHLTQVDADSAGLAQADGTH